MWRKVTYVWILVSWLLTLAQNQDPCYNIDFEQGTLDGWFFTGDVEITNAGNVDPYGGFPQAIGNHSVKIATDRCGSNLRGMIWRSIQVTPANAVIKLNMAMVVLNYPHAAYQAAKVFIRFYDPNGNLLACPQYTVYYEGGSGFAGIPNAPYYTTPGTYPNCGSECCYNVTYVPWTTIWLDLTPYIGQTVTFEAEVRWCIYDVDWAYAYFDLECVNTDFGVDVYPCTQPPHNICAPPDMAWYEWYDPSNNLISTNQCETLTQQGTYTVKFALPNSCGNTQTVKTISLPIGFDPPQIDARSDSVCLKDFNTFSADVLNGNIIDQYKWYVGNGDSIVTPSAVTYYQYPDSGIYDVMVVAWDTLGCVDTAYTTAVVYPPPVAQFQGDTSICVYDTAQFISTSFDPWNNTPLSLSWDLGDGTTVNDTNFILHQYDSAGTYPIKLVVTSTKGCKDSTNGQIIVHPSPELNPWTNAPVCKDSFLLIGENGNYQHTWYMPDGSIVDSSHIYFNPALPEHSGTYVVRAENSAGCVSYDSIDVTVWQRPVFSIASDTSVCRYDSVLLKPIFSVHGTQPYQYRWKPFSFLSCPVCPTTYAFPYDTMTYILRVTDANKCYNYDTVTINVLPLPEIDLPNHTICYYDQLTLDASQPNIIDWKWEPAQLVSCDTCSTVTVLHENTMQTTLNLSLTTTNQYGCQWTDNIKVFVDTGVAVTLHSDTSIFTDGTVYLTAQVSPNLFTYEWQYPDLLPILNISYSELVFTYNQADTFPVVYLSYSNNMCIRSDTVWIKVIQVPECDSGTVFVPTAFTPNGDGVNDILYVYSAAESFLKLFRIYDRWGNLIYELRNQQLGLPTMRSLDGWDGTYNGKSLRPDVYVYHLIYQCGETIYRQKGDVTLLR